MVPIRRGGGLTPSERYLARIADAIFLDLWSYPNVFIDKASSSGGSGVSHPMAVHRWVNMSQGMHSN
jgi:hypothetical protein